MSALGRDGRARDHPPELSLESADPNIPRPPTEVGGRGILGSADSPVVGVTTLGYPVNTQTHSTALSVA